VREHKFRGKEIDSGEWVYGDYRHMLTNGTHWINNDEKFGNSMYQVIPETIGEFTGINDSSDCLLDSDGDKEIYEHDIITFGYTDKPNPVKAVVKYEIGMFIAVSNDLTDGYLPLHEIVSQDREYCWIDGVVIGNVHDNPELINSLS
jgi:uncharacterized phage protein (TIGR01671 family)